jgi:hypothetical protein
VPLLQKEKEKARGDEEVAPGVREVIICMTLTRGLEEPTGRDTKKRQSPMNRRKRT